MSRLFSLIFWNIELQLPRVFMKFAKYKSSSRTDTFMWYGFTHKPGCKQSGFFSKRSPSVLSSGIALNNITITRSKRHTYKQHIFFECWISFSSEWMTIYFVSLLPCPLVVSNRCVAFYLFDLDSIKRISTAVFRWCSTQNLHDILALYLSVVYQANAKPIFV